MTADTQPPLDEDLADLGGDARAAADRPMSADPGVRDTSATGGGRAGEGGGMPAGVAAGGGLGGPAAGAAIGDAREGGDGGRSAADLPHRTSVDQRPATTMEADAETLQARLADEHNIDSELGRIGPGGSGVGNTVAPGVGAPAQQD